MLFVGHKYSPWIQIRSFQKFAGQRPFEFGGDPENDENRYELLSTRHHDRNAEPDEANDYRFLVSVGPWSRVRPRQTIRFNLALVVGEGREGMLETCANVYSTWHGTYVNLDGNNYTGRRGLETRLCFPQIPPPGHWLPMIYAH